MLSCPSHHNAIFKNAQHEQSLNYNLYTRSRGAASGYSLIYVGHWVHDLTGSWGYSNNKNVTFICLFFFATRIYVWNPNEAERGSEIVGEFPAYNQWSFDLDWGKRDPSLVATASVDGSVSIYSLLGGGMPPAQSDKVSHCCLVI